MVLPAAWLAGLVLKNVNGWTFYYALKQYGFHRAYRRLVGVVSRWRGGTAALHSPAPFPA